MTNPVEKFSNITKDFMDEIFGEREGFVYAPTKNHQTDYWQTYFFHWPDQKRDLLTHITEQSRHVDVYLSPSIFKEPSPKKSAWRGSHYVWVEFDGNAPNTLPNGIPEPSVRIQSSTEGHEHWYWRLNTFETDSKVLEQLSKQLSYTLEADLSGWDATQVLRPPGTLHHESRRRVRLTKQNPGEFGYNHFTNLKEVPKEIVVDTNIKAMPDIREVISKYRWPGEVYEMFNRKEQPKGSRSSAMTRLAFHCVEMGMTNEEVYSVLYNADERWGKFKGREDRAKRLVGIIQHVRTKKSLDNVLQMNDDFVIFTLGDFLTQDAPKINWVFEDLLAVQGLGTIAGMPSVGKSTMSFQLAFKSVLGSKFLKWDNLKEMRPTILSLEMAEPECKPFMNTMLQGYTKEQAERLRETLRVIPYGSKFALNKKDNQQKFLDALDQHESDFIIIDSLKQLVTRMRDEEIDEVYEFLNKHVRKDRKCTVWIIHHLRKPGNDGPRKPQDIADLYGDQYIGANATAVLALWKRTVRQVEVMNFKTRMAPETDPFYAMRNNYLDFYVTDFLDTDEPAPVAKKESKGNGNPKPEGNFNM